MDDKIVEFIELLFNSITFDMFLKFAVLYFFIIWIAILVWVIKDISNRTNSLLLQVISILIIMILTPFWIFIYLLVRPWKTLFEKYYSEIDYNLNNLDKDLSENNSEKLEKYEKISRKEEKSKIKKEKIIKENKVSKSNSEKCPKCKEEVESIFHFCPNCKQDLNKKCKNCKKEISIFWDMCPYCWKEKIR